jgi:hypothetical protein
MENKTNKEKCLKEVADLVGDFLIRNGGYQNGYDTYIAMGGGSIQVNKHQYIEWNTPGKKKLTGEQCDKLSLALNDRIIYVLEKYGFKKIYIIHEYDGDGGYKLFIEIREVERKLVYLWDYVSVSQYHVKSN